MSSTIEQDILQLERVEKLQARIFEKLGALQNKLDQLGIKGYENEIEKRTHQACLDKGMER